jgi:hypothetical protein
MADFRDDFASVFLSNNIFYFNYLIFYFAVPFVQYRPVQWFLKPLFFEVPQRNGSSTGGPPLFIGRQWLYREIYDMLTSDSPTNRYHRTVLPAPGTIFMPDMRNV